MLIAGPIVKKIPLACLAGILIVVSYNMSEFHQFLAILKSNKYEISLLLTTFLLTVFVDLVIAIEVGIVLSSMIFVIRMSNSLQINKIIDVNGTPRQTQDLTYEEELGNIPEHILLYEIQGPFFFGAAQSFVEIVKDSFVNISLPINKHFVLIIRMRYVPFIDMTGLQRLKHIIEILNKKKVFVVLSGVNPEIKKELLKYNVIEEKFIHDNIKSALEFAKTL